MCQKFGEIPLICDGRLNQFEHLERSASANPENRRGGRRWVSTVHTDESMDGFSLDVRSDVSSLWDHSYLL